MDTSANFIYAVPDVRRSWHPICAGIHILLGGSNLMYWSGIIEYGIAGPEIVVTSIHGLFVLLHVTSFFLVRTMPNSAGRLATKIGNRSIT